MAGSKKNAAKQGRTIVFIDDGGEETIKLDAPVPAAVARTVAESEAVAPELLRRVTPPEEERRVVAVLRRLDNNNSYMIDRSGFRIGREKRCDLIIPDRKISRLHAEISYQRGQYLLRDVGRTKTKVNGRKIDEPYALQVGDVIQIGRYEFAFLRRVASGQDIVKETEITPVRAAHSFPFQAHTRVWKIVVIGRCAIPKHLKKLISFGDSGL